MISAGCLGVPRLAAQLAAALGEVDRQHPRRAIDVVERAAGARRRSASGALSESTWRSSDAPSFGFTGTSGIPARSAAVTATHVSSVGSAHTATRRAALQVAAPRRAAASRSSP